MCMAALDFQRQRIAPASQVSGVLRPSMFYAGARNGEVFPILFSTDFSFRQRIDYNFIQRLNHERDTGMNEQVALARQSQAAPKGLAAVLNCLTDVLRPRGVSTPAELFERMTAAFGVTAVGLAYAG